MLAGWEGFLTRQIERDGSGVLMRIWKTSFFMSASIANCSGKKPMPRSYFIIGRIWSVVTTSMSGLMRDAVLGKEVQIEVVSVRLAVQQDKRIVGKLLKGSGRAGE